MIRKIIDVVGAYTEYATKNENSYLYNTFWKKGKKKKKECFVVNGSFDYGH
jgi:acyl-homoserine lactone acylase PvdQ